MKEHFTLRYNATLDGDTVMEWDLSFETTDDTILVQRLNTWLLAIGKSTLLVTDHNADAEAATETAKAVEE